MKKLALVTGAALVALVLASISAATAVVSPWSSETVLMSKTGNPVELGTPKVAGSSLVVPYSFRFGNTTFIANQAISDSSTPEVENSNGLSVISRYDLPTLPTLASAPSGQIFTVWQETAVRGSSIYVELVATGFGVIASELLDTDSCSEGPSTYPECRRNLGFSAIEAVAVSDTEIALLYKIRTSACREDAILSWVSNPEEPVITTSTVASETRASYYCSPTETAALDMKYQLLRGNSGLVFAYWINENSRNPMYTYWTGLNWSTPSTVTGFGPSQEFVAVNRSANYISLLSQTEDEKLQLVDFNINNLLISPPVFEFNLDYMNGLAVFGELNTDRLALFIGDTWYSIDSNNNLATVQKFEYEITSVHQAPSGRFLIETKGPQLSAFASDSRWLWAREFGKLVKYQIPDDLDEFAMAFEPNGNLAVISKVSSGENDMGEAFNDGLMYSTLNLAGLPRLENPWKPNGVAKIGQTLTVSTPIWVSYSKMIGSNSISWLACSKAVTKSSSSIPTGCTLIRNASGVGYTVTSADKGKHITAKVSGTNASGTGLTVLPSTGPVK